MKSNTASDCLQSPSHLTESKYVGVFGNGCVKGNFAEERTVRDVRYPVLCEIRAGLSSTCLMERYR